eukprot:1075021-Pyramimonas_sp.AAC.1
MQGMRLLVELQSGRGSAIGLLLLDCDAQRAEQCSDRCRVSLRTPEPRLARKAGHKLPWEGMALAVAGVDL